MLRSKVVCIFILSMASYARVCGQNQEECESVLNRATEEFNAGHFYGIPAMLNDCLNQDQRADWRQRAYLLLAETYLLLDDPFGAEKSYLEILKANPEFVTDRDRDPIDLVYLSSKFTATPIFSLHGKLGLNVSPVHTILRRSAFTGPVNERYVLRPGMHIGGGIDWNYDHNISVMAELNYFLTAYRYENMNVFGEDRDHLVFDDRQNWFRIPVTIKYSDDKGRYRPYGYAGYSIDWLFRDQGTIRFADRNMVDGRIQTDDRESPVLKFRPKRNSLNRSLVLGGGVKYKLGLEYAFIDLRYSFGLTNVVNASKSIEKDETEAPAYTWGYVDNLFRLDNLSVSVGYIYPLYKPRKLKKARSKSISRKIKQQRNEATKN